MLCTRAYPPNGAMPAVTFGTITGPAMPSVIVYSVPITLTNSQSAAFPANAQIMLPINSATYSQYEAGNLNNIEFFYANGTVIPSWLEGSASTPSLNTANNANLYTSTNTIYWLRIYPSATLLCTSCQLAIYMGFASTSTNLLGVTTTGEAPQLSSTYAQYDNGANIFLQYFNMNTNPIVQSSAGTYSITTATGPTGVSQPLLTLTGLNGQGFAAFTMGTTLPSSFIVDVVAKSDAGSHDMGMGVTTSGSLYNGYVLVDPGCTSDSVLCIFKITSSTSWGSPLSSTSYSQSGNTWYTMEGQYKGSGAMTGQVSAYGGDAPTGTITTVSVTDTSYTSFNNLFLFPYQPSGYTTYYALARIRSYPPNGAMPTVTTGTVTGPMLPSGIVYSIPITLTNSQGSAFPANAQIMLPLNSATYFQYEAGNLDNIEFFYANGTVIPSWLEGSVSTPSLNTANNANLYTSTNTIYWLRIYPSATLLCTSCQLAIYMGFASTSTNLLGATTTGEAPELSSTYAQYDNGANVFNNYWNFAGSSGLPAGWTNVGITYSQNNGLTATATAANGYMYYSTSTISSPIVADYYGKVYESTAYFTGVGLTYIPIANNFGYEGYTIATGYGGSDGTIGDYYGFQSNGAGTASLEGPSASGLTSNMMLSLSYISASSASYALNYATLGTSTSPTVGTPVYLSLFMSGAYATSYTYPNTAYIQYVRTRAYPPNGAMPTVTLGTTTGPTLPTGILYDVPIPLTNSQSSAFPANAQIMLPVNSLIYQSYEAGNLDNAEFFYANGTVIPSWLEGSVSTPSLNTANNANLYTSTNTIYWLRIYPSSTFLCASCSNTIYIGFASTSTNLLGATTTGEAPELSSTYAQYDNGNTIFSFYDDFVGTSLSSLWSTAANPVVNNKLTYPNTGPMYSVASFNPQSNVVETYAYSSSGQNNQGSIAWVTGSSWAAGAIYTINYDYPNSGYYQLVDYSGSAWGTGANIAAGSTSTYQVLSLWSTASASYGTLNYVGQATDTSDFVASTSAHVAVTTISGHPTYAYWMRVRLYPPNGVMPTPSFGTPSQPTIPTGILYYAPIPIINSQSSAFPANAQIMIPVNSVVYSSYEAGNLNNAEFFYANGTIIPSWLEGSISSPSLNTANNANLYTSTNTVYWVRIYPSSTFLCASCSNTIYLGWASTSTNLMGATATGEAPELSSTYGQYDNGASIFNLYANWTGTSLPTGWTSSVSGASYSVSSGLTCSGSGGSVYVYYNTLLNPVGNVIDAYYKTGTGPSDAHDELIGWGISFAGGTGGWWGWTSGTDAGLHNTMELGATSGGTESGVSGSSFSYPITVSLSWQTSSSEAGYYNYGSALTNTGGLPTIQNAYPVGGYISSGGSVTYYWFRERKYAPNGVMATASPGTAVATGVPAPTIPTSIIYYLPITLTNAQSSAFPSNTQIMLPINSATYSSYEAGNLDNVEFFYANGTVIPSWLEGSASTPALDIVPGGNLYTSTNTIYWLRIYPSSTFLCSSCTNTIYLGWASTSTNLLGITTTGEAPQLSSTYAQYDNGNYIFPFYDDFVGSGAPNSNLWTIANLGNGAGTAVISNKLTITQVGAGNVKDLFSTATQSGNVVDSLILSGTGSSYTNLGTAVSLLNTYTTGAGITNGYWWDNGYLGNHFIRTIEVVSGGVTNAGAAGYTFPQNSIMTGEWLATGNEQAFMNYSQIQTEGYSGLTPNTNTYVGLLQAAGGNSGTNAAAVYQWIRTRKYAPNGAMPTITLGGTV